MDDIILDDRSVVPTDDLIFQLLGGRKILWQEIHNYLKLNFSEATGSWNFYNDGKRWLYKMVLKKKTIFWGSLLSDSFRITFYFGDKAESILSGSDLPGRIIDDFRSAKKYGAIRAITIKVLNEEDVENIRKLIAIKIKLK